MGLTLPPLTPAQHSRLDMIAMADDEDWENRRRVAGFELLGQFHVVPLLRTPNGRVQTVMPNGKIGSRGPRPRRPRYQTTRPSV